MKPVESENPALARPKILVLGATGGTGRLIVKEALARGFEVRALVRSPAKALQVRVRMVMTLRDGIPHFPRTMRVSALLHRSWVCKLAALPPPNELLSPAIAPKTSGPL